MAPAVAAAGTPAQAGTVAGKGKGKKKEAQPPPPPPKQTILSFFNKAPAKPEKPAVEAAAAEQAPSAAADGVNRSPSSDTPQRPSAQPSSPVSADKAAGGGEGPGGSGLEGGKGKDSVINLSLDRFGAGGAEREEEDCVIVASPTDEGGSSSPPKPTEARADKGKGPVGGPAPAAGAGKEAKAAKGAPKAKAGGGKGGKKEGATPKLAKAAKEEGSKKEAVTCVSFFKPADRKKEASQKERPKHPAGTVLDLEERLLVVAQFASTFSGVLGIEKVTAQALKRDLNRAEPSEVLSSLHVALLAAIVRAGDTPDEGDALAQARMIDSDSWPAVLREHLDDAHATDAASVSGHLAAGEYASLRPADRTSALALLVDDCLATPLVKEHVDQSLVQIERHLRDQQLDEIGDKYARRTDQAAAMESFVSLADTAAEAATTEELAEMTERQRAKAQARAEEERAARAEEERRAREQRLLEEEARKRGAEQQRRERLEERARGLVACGETVRVPSAWTAEDGIKYQYLVMDCGGGSAKGREHKRQVLCRKETEGGDEGAVWSVLCAGDELDRAMEHWSPVYPDAARGFQRTLRDLVQPVLADFQREMDEKAAREEAEQRRREEREERERRRKEKEAERALKRAQKVGGEGQSAIEIGSDAEEGEGRDQEGSVGGDAEMLDAGSNHEEEEGGEHEGMEKEEGEQEGGKEEGGDDKMEVEEAGEWGEEAALRALLVRARDVVAEMEARTPEDMFADHPAWKAKRQEWCQGLGEAAEVPALAESVGVFASVLKRTKMQEGWDEVRLKWKADLSATCTCAALMYLTKQLKVYIGKEKPKPGKPAAVFTRNTRSSGPADGSDHASASGRGARKNVVPEGGLRRSTRAPKGVTHYRDEEEEESGEEMHEEDSDFEVQEEEDTPKKRTRGGGGAHSSASARKSQRTTKGKSTHHAAEREAPRRATRATRGAIANGTYAESSSSASDSE